MRKYSFVKMNGAGNDFIVFDKRQIQDSDFSEDFLRAICDRRLGIGADGVIVIEDVPDSDFSMRYFNADGREGTLCGNGARCAIKYYSLTRELKKTLFIFTVRGKQYSGSVLENGLVKFNMNAPLMVKNKFYIKAFGQMIRAGFADTGSPHVVVNISDVLSDPKKNRGIYVNIDDFPVLVLGKEIRYHKDFAPEGVNVNFYGISESGLIIRTYERGVEDETLACGTGAVATALISYLRSEVTAPVSLLTRSGKHLLVEFEHSYGEFKNISLTGPAEINYYGEF